MTVAVRSLVNFAQTIDSVVLNPFALQNRAGSTAALVAAVAAKTIQMDVVDSEVAGVTVQVDTPLTGTTVTVAPGVEMEYVNPAGTIAALTLNMPASPADGQPLTVAFDQVVTALTMAAPASATIKGALTAATLKGFATWRYNKPDNSWYRVG